nr:sodium-independent anion transporter [uncultured Flavobacterium sp.]
MMYLYRTSRRYMTTVGQIPGTQHFKNIERNEVITTSQIVTLRMDESLYFANARFLESQINEMVAQYPDMKHFILMCSAINSIDASGLESLKSINQRPAESGICLSPF